VKERSYSTAPITFAVYRHTIYTPTLTEREREQERDEKRMKRENTNTVKIPYTDRIYLTTHKSEYIAS
jgi:hypothetical protein